MAKIDYAFPVDKVHGKLSKKHRIGFAHLTASGRNYSVEYGKRSTKPSTSELAHRKKFADCSTATQERMLDPQMIPTDQLGFKNQTKYKTLRGYVFAQVWDTMD
jgi:hypothetical protein